MIDIHCHLLYGVDDGPDTLEESVEMLREAKRQKITDIVLTPHYRHGFFAYPKDEIIEYFDKLQPYANDLGIQLFLGCEYHVNSRMMEYLKSGRVLPMAGTKYMLMEFADDSDFDEIYNATKQSIANGLRPVIAHVERYAGMRTDVHNAGELQYLGAMIQINADALTGREGFKTKQYCKRLIKNGYADIVASDAHGIDHRACHLDEAYEYLTKKFGAGTARALLVSNPRKIIDAAK